MALEVNPPSLVEVWDNVKSPRHVGMIDMNDDEWPGGLVDDSNNENRCMVESADMRFNAMRA